MQGNVSVFMFSTLLMHGLFTGVLVWFWRFNRNTPGLFKLLIASVLGWAGLYLAFDALRAPTIPKLLAEYVFLLSGHVLVWLGIASFWQRQTRILTFIAIVTALGVYLYQALYVVNGGDIAGRVAIASSYYAISSIGVLLIMLQAKRFNQEIFHTAFNQPQVGSSVIAIVFAVHGGFNTYQFLIWDDLGLSGILGLGSTPIPVQVALVEALVFTPILVLGVVVMVAERLQTQLRLEQMTDPVTKGLNKRSFFTVSKVVLARARRNADAVTLLMTEMANFDRLRQKLGRETVDTIIAQQGQCMFEGRRAQDILCRFSNSELLLLLPGTAEEGAGQVIARVSKALKNACRVGDNKLEPDVRIAAVTMRGEDLEIAGMIERVSQKTKISVLQ